MGNKVFTQTFEVDRSKLDLNTTTFNSSQNSLDKKYTIFQSHDKVGIAESVLRTGVWHKNQKRWYKWGTVRAWGLRRTSSGHPMPYHAYRAESLRDTDKWCHMKPVVVFDAMENPEQVSVEFHNAYMKALKQTFNVASLADVYPMAGAFGIWRYDSIQGNLRVPMREKNIQDMVTALFGKTRVTRDWYQAVQNTDPYITALAHQFRGLAKDQEVLGFIKDNDLDDEMLENYRPHTPRLRPILRKVDPSSYSKLLNKSLDTDGIKQVCALTVENMNIKYVMERIGRRKEPLVFSDWAVSDAVFARTPANAGNW